MWQSLSRNILFLLISSSVLTYSYYLLKNVNFSSTLKLYKYLSKMHASSQCIFQGVFIMPYMIVHEIVALLGYLVMYFKIWTIMIYLYYPLLLTNCVYCRWQNITTNKLMAWKNSWCIIIVIFKTVDETCNCILHIVRKFPKC